jgi:cytosine/adenosine deaminase-related metal-dependent hydrolase
MFCPCCAFGMSALERGSLTRRQMLVRSAAWVTSAGIVEHTVPTALAQATAPLRTAAEPRRGPHNIVIANARVIDPAAGLDAIRNVGITRDKIAALTVERLDGDVVINAAGLVLAPGFIDLHCHGQTIPTLRMSASDGVTTALELELGSLPTAEAYRLAEFEGRPVNYGFSASWCMARQQVLDHVEADGRGASYLANFGKPGWKQPADPGHIAQIMAVLEQALKDGALGIGLMPGYAPNSSHTEYLEAAKLAQRYDVPTFTHIRHENMQEPGSAIEGHEELIAAAAATCGSVSSSP